MSLSPDATKSNGKKMRNDDKGICRSSNTYRLSNINSDRNNNSKRDNDNERNIRINYWITSFY